MRDQTPPSGIVLIVAVGLVRVRKANWCIWKRKRGSKGNMFIKYENVQIIVRELFEGPRTPPSDE